MFDFMRIKLFCLEKRLSKHKLTIFSKNLRGHGPFAPPFAYGGKGVKLDPVAIRNNIDHPGNPSRHIAYTYVLLKLL